MADNRVVNGVTSAGVDDQFGEEFYDPDSRGNDADVVELTRKIEALERERGKLMKEIAERKEEIKKLTLEIDGFRKDGAKMREKMEGMEREVERSREASKAAEAIAARAAELETEVTMLQHDSISEMSADEEARTETAELRRVLGEKESRVEYLEREMEGLKQAKAEYEMKVRDSERKIGVMEMKEIEERSKRIRVEEEMRDRVSEKEREIRGFKHKIEELEWLAAVSKSEVEMWNKEKIKLEAALRESEKKAKNMESNIFKLHEEVGEAEKVIRTLKEKAVEAVNEAVNGIDGEVKWSKGSELQWPVVAAGSTGVIAAAAAVIYVCYGKRW